MLKVTERGIVVAAISNTLVKGGIVLFSGSKTLRQAIWHALLLMLAVVLGVAFLL